MRTASVLAICLVLLSLGVLAAPEASHASVISPTADIPIVGGLFSDDENEPDENEPDEGSRPAQSTARPSAASSFSNVLLSFGLGMVAMAFLARWYFRLRSWARELRRGRPTV
jgi:hypothetical protein